jgi:exonuclease III
MRMVCEAPLRQLSAVCVVNVYVPNGEEVGSGKYSYKPPG